MSILNDQTFNSTLGLKGRTPVNQAGTSIESTTHVDQNNALDSRHSKFDLDGQKPAQYTDNLPK